MSTDVMTVQHHTIRRLSVHIRSKAVTLLWAAGARSRERTRLRGSTHVLPAAAVVDRPALRPAASCCRGAHTGAPRDGSAAGSGSRHGCDRVGATLLQQRRVRRLRGSGALRSRPHRLRTDALENDLVRLLRGDWRSHRSRRVDDSVRHCGYVMGRVASQHGWFFARSEGGLRCFGRGCRCVPGAHRRRILRLRNRNWVHGTGHRYPSWRSRL